MTHLVRQRKHAVQVVLMVQQHVRMRAVCTPAVGTVAFAFILIDIDPAVVEAFLQNVQIIFAERLQAFLTSSLA